MPITREEVIDRANTLLGDGTVFMFYGHYYIPFDRCTKNVMILEKFPLHSFLTKNKHDSLTRINTKLLVDVHNIQEEYGGMFGIGETLKYPYQQLKYREDHMSVRYHEEGNALDILPLTKSYLETRELHKACRKVKVLGGRIIYKTHIHLDAMLNRRLDFRRER